MYGTNTATKRANYDKTNATNDRKRKQTDDTDSRNGQNEVQIKYTTTRTCEIQTNEPNRTQNGDKTGTKREQSGTKRTRIWLKHDTNRVQNNRRGRRGHELQYNCDNSSHRPAGLHFINS